MKNPKSYWHKISYYRTSKAKTLIVLYREKKQKVKGFQKNAKITKRSHADKGYARTYSVKILNFFNRELQLKDTEYIIKNKLIIFPDWIKTQF